MKRVIIVALGAMAFALQSGPSVAGQVISFDDERWDISAADSRVEEFMGQQSLYLENGRAMLANADFKNGIIEYDIAFALERGFHAVRWRLQEGGNFEEFYLRPQQSGRPDANQYTPVFNGLAGWQLYFGPQFSAPTPYLDGQWNHVKIVVSGQRADIYVNSDTPVLHIPELKLPISSGAIALTSFLEPVHYANVSVTPMDDPVIIGTSPEPEVLVENAIPRWSISSVFEGTRLFSKMTLDTDDTKGLTWQTLGVEGRGYANIGRVAARLPLLPDNATQASSVFASLKVFAEEAGTRKFRFGYSDRVRVYLNGSLIYGGDNSYRSRDFRYLGTIGLFDELYLPLEKGENSLLFAVGEGFGGWGIMAAFDDPRGLTITP